MKLIHVICGGIFIRFLALYLLDFFDYFDGTNIQNSYNSWTNVREGIKLYELNIDPYDGDIFHENPIDLRLFYVIDKYMKSLIPYIFMTIQLFSSLLLYMTGEQISLYLHKIDCWRQNLYCGKRNKPLIEYSQYNGLSIILCSLYFLNPIIVIMCITQNTSSLQHLILCYLLYSAMRGSLIESSISLALLQLHHYHSSILMIPVALLIDFHNVHVDESQTKWLNILNGSQESRDDSRRAVPGQIFDSPKVKGTTADSDDIGWKGDSNDKPLYASPGSCMVPAPAPDTFYHGSWVRVTLLLVSTTAMFTCLLFALCFHLGGTRYGTGSWKFLRNCLVGRFYVTDYTPNLGISWYTFAESFPHFHPFFVWIFRVPCFIYALPLSVKYRHDPLFLFQVLLIIMISFDPYPNLGDMFMALSLVPAYAPLFPHMRSTLVYGCLFLASIFISPVIWYLWIYADSANANFYYAMSMLYTLAQILLISDLLFAHNFIQFVMYARIDESNSNDAKRRVVKREDVELKFAF